MERTDQKVNQNISTPLPQAVTENIVTNQNSLNSEFVSVGRGNFYLTIENSYSTSEIDGTGQGVLEWQLDKLTRQEEFLSSI